MTDDSKMIEEIKKAKDVAYWERNQLVLLLTKVFPSYLGKHSEADKEWENDWRNIVFVNSLQGQLSWHIHDSELEYFKDLPTAKQVAFYKNIDIKTLEWDGHTTEDKYNRLRNCTGLHRVVSLVPSLEIETAKVEVAKEIFQVIGNLPFGVFPSEAAMELKQLYQKYLGGGE